MLDILDMTAGSRMMWFDKESTNTVYMDKRNECIPYSRATSEHVLVIRPDIQADWTRLPFKSETFQMVVFDPPHFTSKRLGYTDTGIIAKKYGRLFGDWDIEIAEGFREAKRVLKPHGFLCLKWMSQEIPLSKIIKLTDLHPLFGHTGNKQTHWVMFQKQNG